MKSLIVGTAGHIDHGKTALVKALTGIDADRLEEEKRRGITIDLGFAHLELPTPDGNILRIGFVDVPGHERFVRNMLAGVGGIDLVLLVDVYHEFSEPEKILDRIRESLKPNGRIVFLEYRAEDPNVPIRPEHKMTVDQVRAEVQPEGYRFDKTIEVLPQQHIIIFRKP